MKKTPAIIAKMTSLRDSFSRSELDVINYITDHPAQIVEMSVADLSEMANVSDATVVRACQKLGLSGFYELKLTLARNISSPIDYTNNDVHPDDDAHTIMDKVFRNAVNTLQYTHDVANNMQDIENAANLLMNASRVYVFGMGNSASIAFDLHHKLNRIGITAMAVSDPHLQITVATYTNEQDVIFAISYSGSSKDVIDSVQIAKDHNAKIITLTNIGRSPLSRQADISLHTASEEAKYRIWAQSSRVAQLVIIDTIYTIISMRKPEVEDGFRQLDALKVKTY